MFDFNGEAIQRDFIQDIFTVVPPHYDLINRLMTWGLDGRWRRMAVRECLASRPERVLDIGCGTGDLAVALARRAGDSTEVIGIDFSRPMLEIAARKASLVSGSGRLSFVTGDIASLPFPDASFDCLGVSFALRNLTYNNPLAGRYIAEVQRVLSIGGRLVVLETSRPESNFIRKYCHLYLRFFVFMLGLLISGRRPAYRYLVDSATHYYTPEELKKSLVAAGFRQVSCRRLFWGAVSLLTAIK